MRAAAVEARGRLRERACRESLAGMAPECTALLPCISPNAPESHMIGRRPPVLQQISLGRRAAVVKIKLELRGSRLHSGMLPARDRCSASFETHHVLPARATS